MEIGIPMRIGAEPGVDTESMRYRHVDFEKKEKCRTIKQICQKNDIRDLLDRKPQGFAPMIPSGSAYLEGRQMQYDLPAIGGIQIPRC